MSTQEIIEIAATSIMIGAFILAGLGLASILDQIDENKKK